EQDRVHDSQPLQLRVHKVRNVRGANYQQAGTRKLSPYGRKGLQQEMKLKLRAKEAVTEQAGLGIAQEFLNRGGQRYRDVLGILHGEGRYGMHLGRFNVVDAADAGLHRLVIADDAPAGVKERTKGQMPEPAAAREIDLLWSSVEGQDRATAGGGTQQDGSHGQHIPLPRVAIDVHVEGESASAVAHELPCIIQATANGNAVPPTQLAAWPNVNYARIRPSLRECVLQQLGVLRPAAERWRVVADLHDTRCRLTFAQQTVVQPLKPCNRLLRRELALDALTARGTHGSGCLWIAKQFDNACSDGTAIAGRGQKAGCPVFDNLRNSADSRRNHRPTGGHRFQNAIGQAFGARGEHDYIQRVQPVGYVDLIADKVHGPGHAQFTREVLKIRVQRPVADYDELCLRHLRAHGGG